MAPLTILRRGWQGRGVRVKPIRALKRPVSLAEIKADPAFAHWELVVCPVFRLWVWSPLLSRGSNPWLSQNPAGSGPPSPSPVEADPSMQDDPTVFWKKSKVPHESP